MGSNSDAAAKTKQTNTSPADVIMWSGCKDSQTSADATEAGKATGAMSYVSSQPFGDKKADHQAFIAALTKYPQQSYVQLLNTIRDELKGKYDQKPQLSASHREYCLYRRQVEADWNQPSIRTSYSSLRLVAPSVVCVACRCLNVRLGARLDPSRNGEYY